MPSLSPSLTVITMSIELQRRNILEDTGAVSY